VNPDYSRGVNVEDQDNSPNSLLNYYRRLLHLRQKSAALKRGRFLPVHKTAADYLAYKRQIDDHQLTGELLENLLIVLNFSQNHYAVNFSDSEANGECVFGTHKVAGEVYQLKGFKLAPFEVFIAGL
jgi:alpha-glucosidase